MPKVIDKSELGKKLKEIDDLSRKIKNAEFANRKSLKELIGPLRDKKFKLQDEIKIQERKKRSDITKEENRLEKEYTKKLKKMHPKALNVSVCVYHHKESDTFEIDAQVEFEIKPSIKKKAPRRKK